MNQIYKTSLEDTGTEFPLYRKYRGLDTWFCIYSADEFEEIRRIGSKWLKTRVIASVYPEKLFIQDMLSLHENRWEIVSASDYREVSEKAG